MSGIATYLSDTAARIGATTPTTSTHWPAKFRHNKRVNTAEQLQANGKGSRQFMVSTEGDVEKIGGMGATTSWTELDSTMLVAIRYATAKMEQPEALGWILEDRDRLIYELERSDLWPDGVYGRSVGEVGITPAESDGEATLMTLEVALRYRFDFSGG